MFTGIIEELGTVRNFSKNNSGAKITISCKKVLEDLKIGDSVAINGVCQTAVEIGDNYFVAEISNETLKVTTLSNLKSTQIVNLERAMLANGRFGGHIVSGHVDGTAIFIEKINQGIATTFIFAANENLTNYIIKKGSICIDGISLTIADISQNKFSIAVIPHTQKETTLNNLKIGDSVNIETDVLGKYIEKFLQNTNKISANNNNFSNNITEDFLRENGF